MNRFYAAIGFSILLMLGLSSCQKESVAIPSYLQNPALTGKWYLKTLNEVTSSDLMPVPNVVSYTSFTQQDFFEFKANNAATYSSTAIGKSFDGYYSANSLETPQTLTFKSANYQEKYNISTVTKDSLVIYQTQSIISAGITTTIADYYIYKH